MLTLLVAVVLSQTPQEGVDAGVPAPIDQKNELRLSIGSKAPVPEISNFVRGEKPIFFEPGKVYVIEFWATWCGPCKQSMPHLTKIAEEFKSKGVVVIGVSDEKVETVEKFLDKDEWKQKARYTLATDPDRSTHKAYMEAAGQNGIPAAFIIKEGVVQWIGHPMEMDAPLAKIIEGTWDPQALKQTFEDATAEQAKSLAKQTAMTKAIELKEWPKAIAMLDAEIAAAKGEEAFQWRVQKSQLLLMAGQGDVGYALCETLAKEQPAARLWIATGILRIPELADRRADVAINMLEESLKAGGDASPAVLAEIAFGWSLKGDYSKAVDYAQRAVDIAKGLGPTAADYLADLREQVRNYQGKLVGAPGALKPENESK